MNIQNPERRLLQFVHYLRREGYCIGVRETVDASRAMHSLRIPDKNISRNILRTLACRDHEEWLQFDHLFYQFWFPHSVVDDRDVVSRIDPRVRRRSRETLSGLSGSTDQDIGLSNDPAQVAGVGAGKQNTITKTDFRFLNNQKDMRKAERLAEQLASVLRNRLSRRHRLHPTGSRLELRKTLRRNLSRGGEPVKRWFAKKEYEPPHILVLHDVSHSMTWNNPLLFRFVRGIVRMFKHSEAFAFHTRLFRVTDIYRERSLKTMREKLEQNNELWSGGTCIAGSLDTFNQQYANKYLHPGCIVLIISDGFDTDDPGFLAEQMKILKSRSKNIIWLNPLLSRPGYDPNLQGMKEAMPYISSVLPAHSVDSLKCALSQIGQCNRIFRET